MNPKSISHGEMCELNVEDILAVSGGLISPIVAASAAISICNSALAAGAEIGRFLYKQM